MWYYVIAPGVVILSLESEALGPGIILAVIFTALSSYFNHRPLLEWLMP